jgi:hypothetical protein
MTALFYDDKTERTEYAVNGKCLLYCVAIHYVTKNKLFSANKALDLCGVIHALRQSTIWTDRWMKPAPKPPFLAKFTEAVLAEETFRTTNIYMYKIYRN